MKEMSRRDFIQTTGAGLLTMNAFATLGSGAGRGAGKRWRGSLFHASYHTRCGHSSEGTSCRGVASNFVC